MTINAKMTTCFKSINKNVNKKILTLTTIIVMGALGYGVYFFAQQHLQASRGPETIKILSWWGYLTEPGDMQALGLRCHATIELMELYTTDQFLASFQAGKDYDISIYPRSLNPDYVAAFPEPGPDLSDIAAGYYPAIRARYDSQQFPQDTLYFQHDTNLLVYDKNRITDIDALTLDALFAQAQTGQVILQKDFQQLYWLFEQDAPYGVDSRWQQLQRLVAAQQVRLSDCVTALYGRNFLFAYLDSGEVLNPNVQWAQVQDQSGQPVELGYRVHPKFSHISSDLISLKTHSPAAVCVAHGLASQDFLKHIVQTSFYYSPFGDVPLTADGQAQSEIGQEFLADIERLPWLPPGRRTADQYTAYAQNTWQALQTLSYRAPKLAKE